MDVILQNKIEVKPKKNTPKKRIPKPGEHRFVVRLSKEVYASLSLLSHIEDASLNGTIIALISRELVRKKQA